jgi:hypothetical protein
MPLTLQEEQAVRANLFPEAAAVILTRADFLWHRDQAGVVTAKMAQSSQALAIDVFGTLQTLAAPSRIVDALVARWGLAVLGPWQFCLERTVPRTTLGEPRPTQIDASIESNTGLVFFECKFTEADGGACSQTKPLGWTSSNRGKVQCTGDYVLQVNPVNGKRFRCALTGKGVRYWDVVPRVLSVANDVDHRPCPFKGGWYQWMRNLVACGIISELSHKQGAFVILYADGPFPMAEKIDSSGWQEFQSLTAGKAIPLITMSYQELLALATAAVAPADAAVMRRLSAWVDQKVATVGGAT